jgi:hypothetical protein
MQILECISTIVGAVQRKWAYIVVRTRGRKELGFGANRAVDVADSGRPHPPTFYMPATMSVRDRKVVRDGRH